MSALTLPASVDLPNGYTVVARLTDDGVRVVLEGAYNRVWLKAAPLTQERLDAEWSKYLDRSRELRPGSTALPRPPAASPSGASRFPTTYGACCTRAKRLDCTCRGWRCPDHGDQHVGSHD